MTAAASEPLIGVINAGSSSLKFSFYEGERRLLTGQVDGLGVRPSASATGPAGETIAPPDLGTTPPSTPSEVLPAIMPWARERLGARQLAALGHRVVHGGLRHSRPARVTPELLAELEALVPLAPLHEPHNLVPIRIAMTLNPDLPQVACFDTAFHRTASEVEQAFALPYVLYEEGVRRYGFHGLSYEYISKTLPKVAPEIASGRVIVAHLGSGASMCALHGGRSIESTLGFTALDGLPMGTRPGQIDPGVILHLITARGMSPAEVQNFLYRDCGLKGLSGISNDMRELQTSPDPNASFAVEYFVYRAALNAGMLVAALQGIDALVFTAGIGENSVSIRARIAERLAWLGIALDPVENAKHALLISRSGTTPVYVVPTDEELMIAQHTQALLWSKFSSSPQRERAS